MNYFLRFLSLMLLVFSCALNAAPAANPPSVRLHGHLPSQAMAKAVFLRNLDTSTPVSITFTLPLRNQAELEDLIERLYDPTDPQYGHYLSSEEFIERFSPTQEDYDQVIAYAKRSGFAVRNKHPNRTLLNVTAQADSIEKAFNVRLRQYQMPSGRTFYAPSHDPEVERSIASIISGIVGLDNYAVWRSYHRCKEITEAVQARDVEAHTFPSGPLGGFSPSNLIKAYNLTSVSANGSGQAIALFELAAYRTSDINFYTNYFGLPTATLHTILVDGGSRSGADLEVTLDIQLALALAPASEIYVYEGPNSDQGVLDTYNRIATDNIAKQVSTSWGLGEDFDTLHYLQAENAIFLQMAAHGQTIYAAAGDSGAYDEYPNNHLLSVDDPASQPYIVGVGGTRLTVNSTTGNYQSETVWNNGLGDGAGGGGVSNVWSIPSWQANVSTVYSTTHRNVPDVALNADPETGYSIYFNGGWTICGGTSCAAPLWAAFTACVNQQRQANEQAVLGFANPILYSIGKGDSYTTNFHDITTGNNLYYSAGVGYDNATGWGTFNGANLFASLTNATPVPPPPPPELSPQLQMTITDSAFFNKGGTGTYRITVSNQGTGATSGTVSVAIALSDGLSYKSFTGSGWQYNQRTQTFTRSNALGAGASYPPITLKVSVNRRAPRSVNLTATVSGGGSSSSTVTETTTVR